MMNRQSLEDRMRSYEVYHNYKILPNMYHVIRVDGRSFSKLTEPLEKPYSPFFKFWMQKTAEELLKELGGIYGYVQSDEISILLPLDWNMFDRELEKALSTSAGIASSIFTAYKISDYSNSLSCSSFDSRVIPLPNESEVKNYFLWRTQDAARNCAQSCAYWGLVQKGLTKSTATRMLRGSNTAKQNEILFSECGINFNDIPLWQKRGTGLYWEKYIKKGYNPKEKIKVWTDRKRVKIIEELPKENSQDWFEMFRELLNYGCITEKH